MKKFLLAIIILFSFKAYSQTDSSYKTEKIFYISYYNFNKELVTAEDVRLTDIDSISLTFEEVIYGQNSNQNKYVKKKIIYDKINKFGYYVGESLGARFMYGSGIGFAVGAILGAFETGSIVGDGQVPAGTYSLPVGLALAIPGGLIGLATGIGSKENEMVDISKYSRQKKFEIIKRLIKNGVKQNQ